MKPIVAALLVMAIAATGAMAQTVPGRLADCVPLSDIQIDGITLASPAGHVAERGQPDSTSATFDFDDGGWVVLAGYWFEGVRIEVVREVVDRLWTDTPSVLGPRGVRLGMSRDTAARRMGIPLARNGGEAWVPACEGDGGLVLRFGAEDHLVELEASVLRP